MHADLNKCHSVSSPFSSTLPLRLSRNTDDKGYEVSPNSPQQRGKHGNRIPNVKRETQMLIKGILW